ncbi:hypothetical protein [Tenacibaculum sp. SG-28]|uniref:hypothetical protein n=1 Tax=Tenacibaculum sp. SG-28 TaxID=754426 RepID=UPI000CF3F880|nr:hypothetical protein [Tenacibaculum sp. SG-28]PQJ22896.1 hypothetical protein BSU00_00940 [Tenacibaculum sp. SG-28]
MERFVLVNGYINLDNSQLYIDEFKQEVKNRGGLLGIFLGFLIITIHHNLKNVKYFEKLFSFFDFGLRILGIITIIIALFYLIFKKKSKKNLIINEIESIELSKNEFETELTLTFSDKKEIALNFRNLENQINPFIESLKKRNSRIKIEYLN